jgi:carbonic anhydrase/acetyltransferase-like protein (isoleucine patch superfamily)
MMLPKYELTSESKNVGPTKLYRIKALRSFNDVEEGDLGGFVESEKNLSHQGDSWVYHNACVHENAKVAGNARIMEEAEVYGFAKVEDRAVVSGHSKVFQKAFVCGEVSVEGYSSVYGGAQIFDNARITGYARVMDDAWVYGPVLVDGYARVTQKVTTRPIVITGMEYDITIMDDHISIDCQTKSFDDWRHISREEAFTMDGKKAMKFFKHIPDTLEFLVQKYRKKINNV